MSSREGLQDNEHEPCRRIDPRVGSVDFTVVALNVALVLSGRNGEVAKGLALAAVVFFVLRLIRTARAPARESYIWFPSTHALCVVLLCDVAVVVAVVVQMVALRLPG